MVYQVFKNLDKYMMETTGDKLILNHIRYNSLQDREKINNSLITVYNEGVIDMVPACDCGEKRGAYLLGTLCESCGTKVRNLQDKVDPILWMERVEGMPMFMSPHMWLMLKSVMGKKIDCMRWLSDTSYNPGTNIPDFLIAIKNTFQDFERSYPYLINNIENILVFLQNHSSFKTPKKASTIVGLIELYKANKDIVYSNFLPIMNKKLFVVENTSKGRYTNLGIADVIDTVLQFVKTINDPKLTLNKKSNLMARTISDLASIYSYYDHTYLSSKTGVFRKHIYGGRSHFTFRAVITSIPGPHNYNEIYASWSIGVTVFRPQLLNLLMKKGYPYKKASSLLFFAVNNYVPVIDELLNKMLDDSFIPGKIPIMLQRNPGLLQGSLQHVYITKFKKDPSDFTISMSILITAAFNADFDGDELNAIVLVDEKMEMLARTMDPAFSVPGRGKIAEISGLLNLPKPTIATISNYLTFDDNVVPANGDIMNSLKRVEVTI